MTTQAFAVPRGLSSDANDVLCIVGGAWPAEPPQTIRRQQGSHTISSDSNRAVHVERAQKLFDDATPRLFKAVDELSDLTRRILGQHGATRFNEFRRLRKGWDGSNAEPLTPQSVAVLETFTHHFRHLLPSEPSIFLSTDGNLVLGWEARNEARVEVEFGPSEVFFFNEATGAEDSKSIEKLNDLESELFDKAT